jgi:hypothetical protein
MKQRHGPAHAREANVQIVNDQFFHSLNIPVLQGRMFDARDRQGNRPVVIINRRVAKQTFPTVLLAFSACTGYPLVTCNK